MAIRILRSDEADTSRRVLQVQGSLTLDGAKLLEDECLGWLQESTRPVVINLSDVSYLTEEGAAVLRRLKQLPLVSFEGCELFIRQMIDVAQMQ